MIKLYNHETSVRWANLHRKIKGKANGARNYSINITKWYWPIFEEVLGNIGKTVAVVTVDLEGRPSHFEEDVIFAFRHECRYRQQPTIERAKLFCDINSHAQVFFVVWDEDCARELSANGMNAIFLPMAIDVEEIRSHKVDVPKYANRIIYFGNVRNAKMNAWWRLKTIVERHGWAIDRISENRLNMGKRLSRDEILQVIQYYKYGVGVGICAHEMAALGLKVYVYAYGANGHLPRTKQSADWLVRHNLCSPESATVDPLTAIQKFHSAVVIEPQDIKENCEYLRNTLIQLKDIIINK